MIPAAPEVERAADAQPLGARRADDRGHRRGLDGVQHAQQVGLGRLAVLEVEDDPVEAGAADAVRRPGARRGRRTTR